MNVRWIVMLALVSALFCAAGCGNVYLKGEALTAAEASTLHAYQAVQRADAEPATPGWEKAYLGENFKQWRFFVRAARKEETWGPKLEGE